jgi:hypothetical protein
LRVTMTTTRGWRCHSKVDGPLRRAGFPLDLTWRAGCFPVRYKLVSFFLGNA